MNQYDREQFCAFFRMSNYDIIQMWQDERWGPPFSFSPCDVRAAKRAAQMIVRMQRGEQFHVRHARRAQLRNRRYAITDVVVVTNFPERGQEVIELENAVVLRVEVYLQDEALAAFEAEVAQSDGGVLPP